MSGVPSVCLFVGTLGAPDFAIFFHLQLFRRAQSCKNNKTQGEYDQQSDSYTFTDNRDTIRMLSAFFKPIQVASRWSTRNIVSGSARFISRNAAQPCSSMLRQRLPSRPFSSHEIRRNYPFRLAPGDMAHTTSSHVHTSAEIWASRDNSIVKGLPAPPTPYSGFVFTLRINCVFFFAHETTFSQGRSVPVINNDLAGAFSRLKRILDRNSVQKELRLTERHEKKGYKRRRLTSERWRRRFAHEVCSDPFSSCEISVVKRFQPQVRKKVQLVNEIRARGA